MKATNEFVCLKIKEETVKGFKVMADKNENHLLEGEVVSIGEMVSAEFKKGNTVIFDKFKSFEYTVKGQKYYFTNYETIFAKI